MSNPKSFSAGGHPVHQFDEILSFDNPASQGWTTESESATKRQEASTSALETAGARKQAKEVSAAEKRAAFEESKRKWRKENGFKVDAGPPPKKTAEDVEWAKMWMKEEGSRRDQKRQRRRTVDQGFKNLGKVAMSEGDFSVV